MPTCADEEIPINPSRLPPLKGDDICEAMLIAKVRIIF